MRRARDQPDMGIGGAAPHSSPSLATTPFPTLVSAARARLTLGVVKPRFPRRRPPFRNASRSLTSLAVVLLPSDYRLPIIIRRLPPQEALSLKGTLHRPYRCGALLATNCEDGLGSLLV